MGLPGGTRGKEPTYWQCSRYRRHRFNPWVGKIPWRRAWQPTPVLSPRKSPWTEEPGRLQSMGLQRVCHDWSHLACWHTWGSILFGRVPQSLQVTIAMPSSPRPWTHNMSRHRCRAIPHDSFLPTSPFRQDSSPALLLCSPWSSEPRTSRPYWGLNAPEGLPRWLSW